MPELNEPKKVADTATVLAECEAIEGDIAELRAAYEQYFLGIEKRPPTDKHNALRKRLLKLRNLWTRQTSARFRVQTTASKFATYERLWQRTIQEIENGTYVRDLKRVRRKHEQQQATARPRREEQRIDEAPLSEGGESLEQAMANAVAAVNAQASRPPPPVAPVPPGIAPVVPPVAPAGLPRIAPVASASTRPPAASSAPTVRPVSAPPPVARAASSAPPPGHPQLSDEKLRAVYDAFVKAKRRCNEDTSSISYEQVASSLRKQVPELMKQHKARSVEFKVVIKDGKAVLRAVPRDG